MQKDNSKRKNNNKQSQNQREDINKTIIESVKGLQKILENNPDLTEAVITRARDAQVLMSTWGPLQTVIFMGSHAVKTDRGIFDSAILLRNDGSIGSVKSSDKTSLSYAIYLGFLIKNLQILGFLRDKPGTSGYDLLEELVEKIVNDSIPHKILLYIADVGRRLIEIYLSKITSKTKTA